MKAIFYVLVVILTTNFRSLIAAPSRVNIDGVWYTNGQTAYVECGKTSVYVYIDVITDGVDILGIDVTTTPNFSVSDTPSDIEKSLNLDSNKQNGYIDVGYENNPGLGTIRVYVNQKPPMPTFTATSTLCSTGNSATFTVSDAYSFQSTKPLDLVWQTTGGVTVNSGTTYTSTGSTTSSVTIQYNSFGSVSVRGVIPGCSNLQGDAITYWFGAPGSSDITFAATGGGDNGSSFCVGNTRNYQANPNLPLSQYSYSWSIPSGSSNVSYFYSYGPNATVTAGSTGGFLLQMSVTNSACSTTGGSSRTFFISSCGFRVANNPTTDKITALFDAGDEDQSLPSSLRLSSEKNGTIREVKVKGQYSEEAVKNGLQIELDVHSLPRGTYYLQGIYSLDRTESIRIILQ
ncbi:hypothetical protein GO730_35940 [Spirosoma sp. HMF3257]|uniref:Uncharacterized protein n=1 Tax=Spirosoma telluris TaxID=2183553 RepID=A0A327NU85_9BACT|nr:hypothetical protein [Spirosoma telluris]RAI78133.1 hypothetical protein HMF3257_35860 [Spirosoma telluris]